MICGRPRWRELPGLRALGRRYAIFGPKAGRLRLAHDAHDHGLTGNIRQRLSRKPP